MPSVHSSSWVLTHNGAAYPLRGPVADSDISILDIAASLAKLNRWNGHTVRPISVAEHSLLVLEILQREMAQHAPHVLLAALLHDAHEAYTGDVITPIKRVLESDWTTFERPHALRVLQRFESAGTMRIYRSLIEECDRIAAATELRDLMPACKARDELAAGLQAKPVPWISLRSRDCISWQDWQQAYLDQFSALWGALHDLPPEQAALGLIPPGA